MANHRAIVHDTGAHPSVLDAIARRGAGPSGSIYRPRNPYENHRKDGKR